MGCRYNAGLFLIVIVVITWVSSAEVTQGIFRDYKQPFAVTYLGTSLLAVYLPVAFLKDCLYKFLRHDSSSSNSAAEATDKPDVPEKCDAVFSIFEIEHQPSLPKKDGGKDQLTQEEGMPLVSEGSNEMGMLKQNKQVASRKIGSFCLFIAPIWFISEYLANAALARTSVTTTTVLFSSTGVFTLFIGVFLGQDSVNVAKVVSVCVTVTGVAMTTTGKSWATDDSPTSVKETEYLLGCLFGLLSAMTDGLFSVLLKKFVDEEGENADMQKIFGYIGLFTFVALWWLAWPLAALGVEPKLKIPNPAKLEEVMANSLIGNVLSDYFWALGVIWTNPLVAAIGESLTIPLAMLEDMIIHHQHYSLIYILGSAQVFLGFAIANLPDWLSLKSLSYFWNSLRKF